MHIREGTVVVPAVIAVVEARIHVREETERRSHCNCPAQSTAGTTRVDNRLRLVATTCEILPLVLMVAPLNIRTELPSQPPIWLSVGVDPLMVTTRPPRGFKNVTSTVAYEEFTEVSFRGPATRVTDELSLRIRCKGVLGCLCPTEVYPVV